MRQAAAHEAGHFVAYTATGMRAVSARIGRTMLGWGGYAVAQERPAIHLGGGMYLFTAEHALTKAVSTLAGPAAEHFFGDADIYGASGELIEVCLLARKRAEMLGTDFRQSLVDVLTCTVVLLERHAHAIGRVADALVRRRQLDFCNRRDAELLDGVEPILLRAPWPCDPPRLKELLSLFERAPVDLLALVQRIAP